MSEKERTPLLVDQVWLVVANSRRNSTPPVCCRHDRDASGRSEFSATDRSWEIFRETAKIHHFAMHDADGDDEMVDDHGGESEEDDEEEDGESQGDEDCQMQVDYCLRDI